MASFTVKSDLDGGIEQVDYASFFCSLHFFLGCVLCSFLLSVETYLKTGRDSVALSCSIESGVLFSSTSSKLSLYFMSFLFLKQHASFS